MDAEYGSICFFEQKENHWSRYDRYCFSVELLQEARMMSLVASDSPCFMSCLLTGDRSEDVIFLLRGVDLFRQALKGEQTWVGS